MSSRADRRRCIVSPWIVSVLLSSLSMHVGAKDPAKLYMMECQGCHLSDGNGGLNSIPTLQNHVAKFLAVAGGREYLVQVPGVALSSLSDQDITDVLNWMLVKFGPIELARQFAPYTVVEVARLRRQPLADVTGKRADLVSLIEKLKL